MSPTIFDKDVGSNGWQSRRMPRRIGPTRPHRLYLAEWRESKGLTQQQVADRLGVSDVTVSRWETASRKVNIATAAAYAEAVGITFEQLLHHPDRPTPNDLLRDQPPEIVDQAIKLIRAIRR